MYRPPLSMNCCGSNEPTCRPNGLLSAVGDTRKKEAGQPHEAADLLFYPGAPGRIRTADTGFRRAVLYPLSYEGME